MQSQVIRLSFAVCLFLMIATLIPGKRESKIRPAESGHLVEAAKRAELVAAYGKLSLRFEANRGQAASPVKFVSRNSGQTLFLTADEAILELRILDFGFERIWPVRATPCSRRFVKLDSRPADYSTALPDAYESKSKQSRSPRRASPDGFH